MDSKIFKSNVQPKSSYLKKKFNTTEKSTFRKAIPQLLAVIAINVMSVALGTSAGFIRVIIPCLSDNSSDIPVSSSEVTWISSSMFFLTPVGYTLSGPITQYFGRRQTLLLTAIPYSLIWLLLYHANSAKMIIISLGLIGITTGLIHSPITMYVAEISRPHLRGAFLIFCPLAMSFGMFAEMLIGRYTDWRTITLVNFGIPVVGFFLLLLIPESPHWLASNNKLNETERCLCWLRGWVSPEHVKAEYKELKKMFANRSCPLGEDESRINSEHSSELFLDSLSLYAQRTFWLPFLLLFFILAVKAFGGTIIIQTYTTVIFDWLKSPMENNLATTITSSLELVACLISILVVHFVGKRKLTILSLLVLSILHFMMAFYCFSIDEGTIQENDIADFAVALLISIAFFSQLGIKLIPHILMGEIFPMKTRSIGVGLVNTLGYSMISVANKIFYQIVDLMKLSGTFLFFGIVNLIGCVVLYFLLLETEGKSLQEIEIYFAASVIYTKEINKKHLKALPNNVLNEQKIPNSSTCEK